MRSRTLLFLVLLTAAAFFIHGYHPWSEDSGLYITAVKKELNPALYPFHPEFFMSHARLTLFDELIAGSVRWGHLPLAVVLLVGHLVTLFLMLAACWHLARLCFESEVARWGGVALIAALLTLPVSGTALYFMDPYLNPRSFSTPAALFALVDGLESRWARASLWLAFAAVIHPLMALFGVSYLAVMLAVKRGYIGAADAIPSRVGATASLLLLPLGLTFGAVSPAYHEALMVRKYFFLRYWAWYEWLGIFGPMLLLWAMARFARGRGMKMLELVSRATLAFGAVFFALALAIAPIERLTKMQPMRSLQIVYIVLFLCGGGLLAHYVLKRRVWLWLALFVPLSLAMYAEQRQLYALDPHIEWPGRAATNPWMKAFLWIRDNTPQDAVFAIDPEHGFTESNDSQRFRTVAERDRVADDLNDSGAAAMFPQLAEEWQRQYHDVRNWKQFQVADFRRLRQEYGVTWVLLDQPGLPGMTCPYQNAMLRVCRVE